MITGPKSRHRLSFALGVIGAVALLVPQFLFLRGAIREGLSRAVRPVHGPTHVLATSDDGSMEVVRDMSCDMFVQTKGGNPRFEVRVVRRSFSGQTCCLNSCVPAGQLPSVQRWNELDATWEVVDPDDRLTMHALGDFNVLLVPVGILFFVIHLCGVRGRWLSGALTTCAVASAVSVVCGASRPGWRGGCPTALDFSPDGTVLAVATQIGDDSEVTVWDTATGRGVARYPLASRQVKSLEFTQAGNVLTAIDTNDTTYQWDVVENQIR